MDEGCIHISLAGLDYNVTLGVSGETWYCPGSQGENRTAEGSVEREVVI